MPAIAAALCGLLACTAPARARDDLPSGQKVTVSATTVAWGPQPPYAGVVAFYRRLVIAEYGVVPRDVWALWLGDTSLPPVGAECRVTYHFGMIDGVAIEAVNRLRDQRVLDGFVCKP